MDPLRYYRRLMAFDRWANAESLTSLQELTEPPLKAVRLMAHVIGAQCLWFSRVRGEAPHLPVWPDLDLATCAMELADISQKWEAFLRTRTPDGLRARVTYASPQNESWTNAVEDILMHVVVHSAHHRGQIAAELREAGATPRNTDFVYAIGAGVLGGRVDSVARGVRST